MAWTGPHEIPVGHVLIASGEIVSEDELARRRLSMTRGQRRMEKTILRTFERDAQRLLESK